MTIRLSPRGVPYNDDDDDEDNPAAAATERILRILRNAGFDAEPYEQEIYDELWNVADKPERIVMTDNDSDG